MTNEARIEVFYVDPANGWATAEFTSEGYQTDDEARYSYLKQDAIREARAMAGGIMPILVHGKDGQLQRVLNSACVSS